MKLAVMSDLHLDLLRDYGHKFVKNMVVGDAEALVIAGDFASTRARYQDDTAGIIEALCDKWPQVIMIPGNHDAWHSSLKECWTFYFNQELKHSNFKVLSVGGAFEFKGQRFVGDTLWFKYEEDMEFYLKSWPDFIYVDDFWEKAFLYNEGAVNFFKNSMKEGDILVTHHMPHPNAVAPKYRGDPTNMFFLCDISPIIAEKKPKLAIFGHTHVPFDFKDGDTRFYCNPLGYVSEGENKKFAERIMIEV